MLDLGKLIIRVGADSVAMLQLELSRVKLLRGRLLNRRLGCNGGVMLCCLDPFQDLVVRLIDEFIGRRHRVPPGIGFQNALDGLPEVDERRVASMYYFDCLLVVHFRRHNVKAVLNHLIPEVLIGLPTDNGVDSGIEPLHIHLDVVRAIVLVIGVVPLEAHHQTGRVKDANAMHCHVIEMWLQSLVIGRREIIELGLGIPE